MLGIGALGLGISSDLQTRSALRQARSELSASRSQLARTLRSLSSVESNLLRTSGQRTVLQSELTTTTQELASAQANLSKTQAGLSSADDSLVSQGIDIAVLNACLGGVERALNQIAVGDNGGAVTSISAVSGSCQALRGQGTGGPVFPFDFPDPDVIRVGQRLLRLRDELRGRQHPDDPVNRSLALDRRRQRTAACRVVGEIR